MKQLDTLSQLCRTHEVILKSMHSLQILGEDDYEVVTLSHRAQIKRVCNDLQKVLRPRKPKCISSVDMPAAFASHWQAVDDADRSDRRFNVEDFGVCYLDDLLVTIPQHWGVHCSEYVSTDGEVIRREHGNGDEDIPDFVPKNETGRVHAWIPKHHQTETQKKALALLKQQVLDSVILIQIEFVGLDLSGLSIAIALLDLTDDFNFSFLPSRF